MHRMGIPCTSVHNLFFTHLHSDHISDYLCFLMTRFDQCIGTEPDLARLRTTPNQAHHRRHLEPQRPLLVRRDRPHQSPHERPRLPDARRRG